MTGQIHIGTLEGKIGEEIVLRLVEQGAAGYRWAAHFDSRFLELVGDTNKAIGRGRSVGGPSRREFRFRLKAQGETELAFKHIRPWLPDDPSETQAYLVKIHRYLRIVGP